jgi:protein-tyrosine-phosphatase
VEEAHKENLPPEKTFTLKEYVNEAGDVADPIWSKDQEEYNECCLELKRLIDKVIERLDPKLNNK